MLLTKCSAAHRDNYLSTARPICSLASPEAGVPPKRAQEILGHADVRTTLAIYTHAMKRKHD